MEKKNLDKTTDTTSMKKADAFLNIEVRDSNGDWHSIPTGIALHKDNSLEASLIKSKEPEELKIRVRTLNVIGQESKKKSYAF